MNIQPTKMTKRGALALGQSVIKWVKIVDGKEQAQGYDNCPLCRLYHLSGTASCSSKCPVVIHTGMDNCEGTPYADFIEISHDGTVTDRKSKKAAKAVLDHLIEVAEHVPYKGFK